MEWSVFRAVEASIFERVQSNGNNWNEIQAARNLIGNSYSDQGLATENATMLPFWHEPVRWAYAHLYVTPHVHMVKDFLGQFWESRKAFKTWHSKLSGKPVHVCSIGGGPGSDILGFALFIRLHQLNVSDIRGNVLDRWTEWESTFHVLLRHLDPQSSVLFRGGTDINYCDFNFHEIWERHSTSWIHLQCLRGANLVTMVKFISAVSSNREECEAKLTILLQLMKEGALFFFLDNAGGGYAALVCRAAVNAGLHQIGKIEHVDKGLPDNEGQSINSSRLCLTRINSSKTWKVSALLFLKGNVTQFHNRKQNRSAPAYQVHNPNIHQHILPIPQTTVLPQFRFAQTSVTQIPRTSTAYPTSTSANTAARQVQNSQAVVTQQSRSTGQPLRTSEPNAARIHTSVPTKAQTVARHQPTPSTRSSTPAATPVRTTQPRSMPYNISSQTEYSHPYNPTQHRHMSASSYPTRNLTATSGPANQHPIGNRQTNSISRTSPNTPNEENSSGCCSSIMACFGCQ